MQHVPGCMAWYAKVSHPQIISVTPYFYYLFIYRV